MQKIADRENNNYSFNDWSESFGGAGTITINITRTWLPYTLDPNDGFWREEYDISVDELIDDQTQGGGWWFTDKQGEFLFNHWQNGNGEELFLNNTEWGDYMRADKYLTYLISNEMKKRYVPGYSGTVVGRMHGETQGSGYRSGYELLNGSNDNVGDLEFFGNASLNSDGSSTYNLIMTFHDVMDPNFKYTGDKIGASIFPGTPYDVHITWGLSIIIAPPPPPTKLTTR